MSISKWVALGAAVLTFLTGASSAAAAIVPEMPETTFAVSTSAGGELAGGVGTVAETPVQISEDGRYVAFRSAAQNLGAAGPPGVAEGFVKDLETGRIELATRGTGADGEPSASEVTQFMLSGDGRHVVFTTEATNLGTTFPPGSEGPHVYERDLETGVTTLVDRVTGPEGAILSRRAEGNSISADGNFVAFVARVADLEDPLGEHEETNEEEGFVGYVRNLTTGTTEAVSRANGPEGEIGDRSAEFLSLSPDGRYVTFISSAENLGSGVERYLTYLRDTVTDTTSIVSRNSRGEVADAPAYGGYLSGGAGCYGSLETRAENLIEPPPIEGAQSYVFDRCGAPGAFSLISLQENGEPFYLSIAAFGAAAVTSDGTKAIFAGSTDSACGCHLFLRDLPAARTTTLDRASGATGALADDYVQDFGIAAGGCRVAFSTSATNLVATEPPDPAEEPTEVYVRQLAPCPKPASPSGGSATTQSSGGVGSTATANTARPATGISIVHLGRKALWLLFDGPGRSRIRIQIAVGGRHHGWHRIKALIASATEAGPVKVPLPRLGAGSYRFKLRLQGDPDNLTLTRRLRIAG